MSLRWTFYDTYTLETVDFEINPNEGGSPALKKNITTQSTAAPNGKTLLMEGRDAPKTGTFTGTLLTQTQFDMLTTWFNKRHPIEMTDDLNRTFVIYITDYQAKRERAIHSPYKHTYTVNYVVVDL